MITPPRIKPGDTIGIVAPAGPIKSREALQRGLDHLASTFTLVVGDTVTAARDAELPSYLAASDAERADGLNEMFANPDIRAIVCARGGYGLTRILDRLDPTLLLRDPKPIVGFSDASALLAWAYAAGVRGVHGPVVGPLGHALDIDQNRTDIRLGHHCADLRDNLRQPRIVRSPAALAMSRQQDHGAISHLATE